MAIAELILNLVNKSDTITHKLTNISLSRESPVYVVAVKLRKERIEGRQGIFREF